MIQQFITQFYQQAYQIYQKAEVLVNERRQISLSQDFLNDTLQQFVTDNLGFLQDLHMELHDHWLRLFATLRFGQNQLALSVDLKLVDIAINHEQQLFVFQQISHTRVLQSDCKDWKLKFGIPALLFFYHKILQQDPLGLILSEKGMSRILGRPYKVVDVKDGLLHLDLMQWLGGKAFLNYLKGINIDHAEVQQQNLRITGQILLDPILNVHQFFNQDYAPLHDEHNEVDVNP
ncbi:MAG: hypothetical protein Q4D05_06830 [Acinetobacter sp.]|nr:hypothetical protein [Acinetobacter sp.]